MTHTHSEDAVFDVCASCTLLVVGAAFAALVYQLFAMAVPLVELMLSPRMLMMRGF